MEKLLKFFILTTFYLLTISEYDAFYIEDSQLSNVKGARPKNEGIRANLSPALWKDAIIPFKFHKSIGKKAKKVIKKAMFEWESKTCIRFVKRSDEKDYVEFISSNGCNADVGRRGGRQEISVGAKCLSKSVIIHDIGHLIGFWEEHNRFDRDEYVTVHTGNILTGYKWSFTKKDKNRMHTAGLKYDYHSIMHYGMKAFSRNGRATILPKDPTITALGNHRLSQLDIKKANILYECD